MNKITSKVFFENLNIKNDEFSIVSKKENFKWGDTSDIKKLNFLMILVKEMFHNKNILEIGTYRGSTTYNIASILTDGIICTVDCGYEKLKIHLENESIEHNNKINYQEYEVGEIYKKNMLDYSRIKQIIGDTTEHETVNQISNFSPYDLIYIDASHTYQGIKNDTEIAFKSLKQGGMIIWDDYNGWWEGVNRYLDELKEKFELIYILDNRYVIYCDK
jgi:predicted O-methyltransferase YrrM